MDAPAWERGDLCEDDGVAWCARCKPKPPKAEQPRAAPRPATSDTEKRCQRCRERKPAAAFPKGSAFCRACLRDGTRQPHIQIVSGGAPGLPG